MTTDTLADLPPSAKLVAKALEYRGEPLTHDELVAETRLPSRTAWDALMRLRAERIVEKRTNGEARYQLRTPADAEEPAKLESCP